MAGTANDIKLLRKLEEVDKTIEEGVAQFNESPIAKKIAEVRQKKAEVKQKRDQVDKVFIKARTEMQEVSDKDSLLAEAQKKEQKEIQATQGDYRKVEAHTNKLNEITQQRKQVDSTLEGLESNFNKIKSIKEKIDDAIGRLSMQEDDLSQKLNESNNSLKISMEKAQKEKATLETEISEDALKLYKKSKQICGKIVMSQLNGSTCAVCRSSISNANMSKIKGEAPISMCPNCSRILAIE